MDWKRIWTESAMYYRQRREGLGFGDDVVEVVDGDDWDRCRERKVDWK